jgi:plastocyanin
MDKSNLIGEEPICRFFKIILVSVLVIFCVYPASSKIHAVKIVGDKFIPDHLEIMVGDTVTWFNKTGDYHTSTSGSNCNPDGAWDSEIIENGKQFTHVFKKKGRFPYFCMPHCRFGMTGLITVVDANKSKGKKTANINYPPSDAGQLPHNSELNRTELASVQKIVLEYKMASVMDAVSLRSLLAMTHHLIVVVKQITETVIASDEEAKQSVKPIGDCFVVRFAQPRNAASRKCYKSWH